MGTLYRSEIRIARQGEDARLMADLPGGEALPYRSHPVAGDPADSVCSTLDHIVAAAGW